MAANKSGQIGGRRDKPPEMEDSLTDAWQTGNANKNARDEKEKNSDGQRQTWLAMHGINAGTGRLNEVIGLPLKRPKDRFEVRQLGNVRCPGEKSVAVEAC